MPLNKLNQTPKQVINIKLDKTSWWIELLMLNSNTWRLFLLRNHIYYIYIYIHTHTHTEGNNKIVVLKENNTTALF